MFQKSIHVRLKLFIFQKLFFLLSEMFENENVLERNRDQTTNIIY